jgi:hypothetical protein
MFAASVTIFLGLVMAIFTSICCRVSLIPMPNKSGDNQPYEKDNKDFRVSSVCRDRSMHLRQR